MSSYSPHVPAMLDKKGMFVCSGISITVIAIYFIPYGVYLLYPFMLIYTFIHEMGHGIAAILVGGEFHKFEMWADGSGVASNVLPEGASRMAHAFVAFGGLVAPAIMAAICFILGRSGKTSRIGLYIFTGICALSMIFVVRNLFSLLFLSFCAITAIILAKIPKKDSVPQYSMLTLAITLLTAVFSRGDYLFTETAQTAAGEMPSDVGQIAINLFLPYWFWGGLIGLISIIILFIGIRAFFCAPKEHKKIQ